DRSGSCPRPKSTGFKTVVQPSGDRPATKRVEGGWSMRSELEQEYVDYVSARLGRLHRAAFLLCGDADRADDVVQATLTSLYMRWSRARGADDLDAYTHKILIRRFLDERRRPWARVL